MEHTCRRRRKATNLQMETHSAVRRAQSKEVSAWQGSMRQSRLASDLLNHILSFVVCLLAAHYIMTYEIGNWRPGKMNIVYMIIALAFGFDFYVRARARTAVAIVLGFATGLVAVLTMSAVVWFISDSAFFGGRQERVDAASAIMLAYAGGNAAGAVIDQVLPTAFAAGNKSLVLTIKEIIISARHAFGNSAIGKIDIARTAIQTLTTLILAIGARWVALKGLFTGP
jgi:hypothetical protein